LNNAQAVCGHDWADGIEDFRKIRVSALEMRVKATLCGVLNLSLHLGEGGE
jgi:hypothetical protein